MDKVIYCIPTFNSFELCRLSVEAVMAGRWQPDFIIIRDDSGDGSGYNYLHPLEEKYPNLTIMRPGVRSGVAGCWNAFMRLGKNYTIIANDDIEVHHNTIADLIRASIMQPDQIFFAGSGHSGNAFSLFLLTQDGYNKVGPFDERFYPAYYEDNDYARRMKLLGYGIITVDSATYNHTASSTLKAYTHEQQQAHHKAFQKNTQYYQFKWGGMPGFEKYDRPFDGGNPL